MDPKRLNKADIVAALQEILANSVDAGVPGLSAEISTSYGVLWQSTAGLIDVEAEEPVNKENLFGIGSITKVFVAVVVLQLVDEMKLNLLDTVEGILDPSVFEGIANASKATIAGLLSHTTGIDSWEEDPSWIVHGRGKELVPEKIWEKLEALDYIRRPNSGGPEPGKWSYSNTNFTLLGLIVEKITRHTTEGEIRRRILGPLKMNHTYLEGFEEAKPHTAPRRYHWDTAKFRSTAGICPSFTQLRENLIDATGSNLSVEWTAGGLISSPSDLIMFGTAIRDGKLLSPSSLKIMKEWRPAKSSMEMGHGLFRFQPPESAEKWLGHPGDVLGFTGALFWKEKGDCVTSVLANIGTVHAGSVPSSASNLVGDSTFLKLASDLAACVEQIDC